MANLQVKDATGTTRDLSASGDGSVGTPFIPNHGVPDGSDIALGAKADAPSTATQDTTPVSGITLWKSVTNYLKKLADAFLAANTARTTGSLVMPVQPIGPNGVAPSYVVPSLAADIHAPSSATAAVVTYGADATKKHVLYGIAWSYNATPTGGNLKIEDVSGTTVFTVDITTGGVGFLEFDPPIIGSAINTAMIVTLASGGTGVTGKLSCRHELK